MFKALKEKVSNEYEKAKVNIQTQAQNLVSIVYLINFVLFENDQFLIVTMFSLE